MKSKKSKFPIQLNQEERVAAGVGVFFFTILIVGSFFLGRWTFEAFSSQSRTPIKTEPAAKTTQNVVTQASDDHPEKWKTYNAKDPQIKMQLSLPLPPELVMQTDNNGFVVTGPEEKWRYQNSIFSGNSGIKNYYSEGSRRDWYQKFLNGEFTDGKSQGEIQFVQEKPLDQGNYLEISVRNGDTLKTHYLFSTGNIIHMFAPEKISEDATKNFLPEHLPLIIPQTQAIEG